jgi:hypothetical protein
MSTQLKQIKNIVEKFNKKNSSWCIAAIEEEQERIWVHFSYVYQNETRDFANDWDEVCNIEYFSIDIANSYVLFLAEE